MTNDISLVKTSWTYSMWTAGADATPKFGLRRPFNFIGDLKPSDISDLSDLRSRLVRYPISLSGVDPVSAKRNRSGESVPRTVRDILLNEYFI